MLYGTSNIYVDNNFTDSPSTWQMLTHTGNTHTHTPEPRCVRGAQTIEATAKPWPDDSISSEICFLSDSTSCIRIGQSCIHRCALCAQCQSTKRWHHIALTYKLVWRRAMWCIFLILTESLAHIQNMESLVQRAQIPFAVRFLQLQYAMSWWCAMCTCMHCMTMRISDNHGLVAFLRFYSIYAPQSTTDSWTIDWKVWKRSLWWLD